MKMLKMALLGLTAAIAAPALGVMSNEVVVDPHVPSGFVANALMWDGGGSNDWTSSGITIDFAQGSAYQDPFETAGGAAPPAVFIPHFPSLAFDTHVGIIGDGSVGIFTPGGCIGDCLPLSQNAPQINLTWFNTDETDTGVVQIGMMTLSDDAQGTWSYVSAGVRTDGVVVNGEMVPEPASLALLGLGGFAVLRRQQANH